MKNVQELNHFSTMNTKFSNSNFLTHNYEWNGEKIALRGDPIQKIIDFGIQTPTSSMFCLESLIEELIEKCKNGEARFCYAASGINALWLQKQILLTKEEVYKLDQVRIVRMIRDLVSRNWVLTCILYEWCCKNRNVSHQ